MGLFNVRYRIIGLRMTEVEAGPSEFAVDLVEERTDVASSVKLTNYDDVRSIKTFQTNRSHFLSLNLGDAFELIDEVKMKGEASVGMEKAYRR